MKPRLSQESAEAAREIHGVACVSCLFPASEWHHVFSQQKWPALADSPHNLIPLCGNCHTRHTNAHERLLRSTCRHAERELVLTAQMMAYLDRTYA